MSRRLLLLPRPVKLYCADLGERRATVAYTVCNPGGVSGSLEIVLELPGGYTVHLGPVDLGALGSGGCTTVVGDLPGELVDRLCGGAPREHYTYRSAVVARIPCYNLDRVSPLFEGRECVFLCENVLGGTAYYIFSGMCGAGRQCVLEAHLCGYYGQCGLAFTRSYQPQTDSMVNVYVGKGASPYTSLVVCWSGFDFVVVSEPYVSFPYASGRALVELAWASLRVDGVEVARYAVPVEARGLTLGWEARVGGGGRLWRPFQPL